MLTCSWVILRIILSSKICRSFILSVQNFSELMCSFCCFYSTLTISLHLYNLYILDMKTYVQRLFWSLAQKLDFEVDKTCLHLIFVEFLKDLKAIHLPVLEFIALKTCLMLPKLSILYFKNFNLPSLLEIILLKEAFFFWGEFSVNFWLPAFLFTTETLLNFLFIGWLLPMLFLHNLQG